MKTAGPAARLELVPDRKQIKDDGRDLSFVTVRVTDTSGIMAPRADNHVQFTIDGPGEIVATDNGDPTSFVPFPSHERDAFSGLVLVIVRAKLGQTGAIRLKAESNGLQTASVTLQSVKPGI
jgi:beta-galactosidase